MKLQFDEYDLALHHRIKVDLVVPESADKHSLNDWSMPLLEQETWFDSGVVAGLESIDEWDRLFIQAFFHTSRLLFELGRLPIFEVPRVISITQLNENPKKYALVIELSLVHFLPLSAYQIPVKASLKLCRWMAQNGPIPENKKKVFDTITEKVISPFRRLVPAGKSTIPLLKAAHKLKIPFTHLGLGVYQLGWGSKSRKLDRSTCELDSAIGSKLTQNKVSTANVLRVAGLPSPVHGVVATKNDALALAMRLGFPVVVKPTDRDRGEGVTVDVTDESTLKAAFTHAQKLSRSKQVIVERQVSGVCHRLFIANNKLLYAVKRHPMSVVGDGNSTIQELVDHNVAVQNNKPPWSRSEIKPIDELALNTLRNLRLSTESVPDKGALVPLRRIESTEWGGVDEEVTTIVHHDNLKAALQATKLFGLNIAGIDIISPDITKPWHANGAIINEVNFAPLFGGAEISRSFIPAFFAEFIDGDGKIPIKVFETEEDAFKFQTHQIKQGKRCYLITADKTIDDSGKEIIMPFKEVKRRLSALTIRQDVEAISIWAPSAFPAHLVS